jgi:hypothetical protein
MSSYNGSGAPQTPLPANTKAEMLGVGKEALKIARDVVKEGMK